MVEIAPYCKIVLAAALVRRDHDEIAVCLLRSGEYRGYWGFPAGYVEPQDRIVWEEPQRKAVYEITKYLGLDEKDIEFIGELTEESPLVLEYTNPAKPEARIFEYLVKSPDVDLADGARWVRMDELSSLMESHPINPLVPDVVQIFKNVLNLDLQRRTEEYKATRMNVIDFAERRAEVLTEPQTGS